MFSSCAKGSWSLFFRSLCTGLKGRNEHTNCEEFVKRYLFESQQYEPSVAVLSPLFVVAFHIFLLSFFTCNSIPEEHPLVGTVVEHPHTRFLIHQMNKHSLSQFVAIASVIVQLLLLASFIPGTAEAKPVQIVLISDFHYWQLAPAPTPLWTHSWPCKVAIPLFR